ncbi:hypothetical protein ACGFYQ_40905 [Streptomyces sp. NPDC048258]|uniref:hypothetical protein n=1 Tax=Streptomyces sp. NPDC048258 TaxID=3365527 RepID=UPI0037169E79
MPSGRLDDTVGFETKAVKVLEGVAHLVSKLSSDQRSELIDLLGTMAEAESDPARREFLDGFPEGFVAP